MESERETSNPINPEPNCSTEAIDYSQLKTRILEWTQRVKSAAALVTTPSPDREPFKNVYAAIEDVAVVNFEVDTLSNAESVIADPVSKFWIRFTKIHVLSSLAKWNEVCEELSVAEQNHVQCLDLIEKELAEDNKNKQNNWEDLISHIQIDECTPDHDRDQDDPYFELRKGLERVKYMYIYELTRYAILCSERDNQEKALELLKKAEVFYHDTNVKENLRPVEPGSILGMLDSLNSESSKDMFTYVLFYLGQAYKIKGEKERAILYLHMVLRRQLEKGDYNNISWGSDSSRMASVLMVNAQAFDTARNILVAATTVMKKTPEEEKSLDNFRQNWADLGRTWAKFGVSLLESSCDRLKDLEEDHSRRLKFESRMKLSKYEKLSLEISDDIVEYDTLLLIKALKFPTLDVSEVNEVEMKGRFVRDFDEARSVFMPAQRWINVAKEYYNLEEFAGDHIDLVIDYAALFKHIAFFEPSLDRQIKMHKRRVAILEELLKPLNPKIYSDIFHMVLRDLAETYETIYKLKVDECKDRGKSLRPKDKKLVQWLVDAVGSHKRNLQLFDYALDRPEKAFPIEYEKILMACVLSIARILGSICHDHPLHDDAISLGEESKQFYTYFLEYLDRRIELKTEFRVLYEGSQDMPELLDNQIRKIRHHQRMRSAAQSEDVLIN